MGRNPEEVNGMENISTEQKLQLVQQIRSRYHENRYDLSNRERILYGKASTEPEDFGQAYPYSQGNRASYGNKSSQGRLYPYGRSHFYETSYSYGAPYGEEDPADAEPLSFFRLRMWIALFLVAAVIVMDRNGMEVAGVTTEKIFQAISEDYEEVLETWVEAISR